MTRSVGKLDSITSEGQLGLLPTLIIPTLIIINNNNNNNSNV